MHRSTTSPEHDQLRQLAESTESSAVREAFDLRNTRVLRVVAAGLAFFGLILFLAYLSRFLLLKIVASSLLLSASVAMFLISTGRTLLARHARPFVSEWLIGLLAAQFLALVLNAYLRPQDVSVFASTAPWLVVVLWMTFARRLLVHAFMVVVLIVAIETTPAPLRMDRGEYYGPAISSNVFALLLGGFLSRRARQRVAGDWRQRHASAVEQLRMREELQLAREVQLSMLPEAPPQIGWLDVAAVCVPATEVGGDYYDYFRVGERIALVCGDVAGHGLASGIALTALRSGFTLLRDSLADPAAVLTRLHDLVEHTSRRRMLATAAVVVIDPVSQRARIASAGHPPVMIRSGRDVRAIELFGPPLGVRLPVQIAQTEVETKRGDVLVLHSDGLYETANAAGELYGLDRLATLIAAAETENASAVVAAIIDDVTSFRGEASQEDDLTIVVAILR